MAPSRQFMRLDLLLLQSLTLFQVARSAGVIDFSLYPTGGQACLYSAASTANCDSSTVPKFNTCVCSNGGNFVLNAAKCIGANSPNDSSGVYSVMSRNCADSNTPLAVTAAAWNAAAASGATTTNIIQTTTVRQVSTVTSNGVTSVQTSVVQSVITTSAAPVVSTITLGSGPSAAVTVVTFIPAGLASSPAGTLSTTSSTSTSTAGASSDDGSKKGLSTEAIIGVAVGVPLFLALVALVAVLVWRGKRSSRQPPPPDNTNTLYGSGGHPPMDHSPATLNTRPVSSVTTLSPGGAPVIAGATYAKTDYSPPVHYGHPQMYPTPQTMYNPPQPPTQWSPTPPPPQGMVEMHGTPAVRPQELPGQYHY